MVLHPEARCIYPDFGVIGGSGGYVIDGELSILQGGPVGKGQPVER